MTFLLKDPAAVLDYSIDWGADYLGDTDSIAESSWSVSPDEDGGIVVVGSDFGERIATVNVGGGVAGRIYRVTNRLTTQSGQVDERSILLRVEKR